MRKQCNQCAGTGDFPIIGSQCTGCFGIGSVDINPSVEKRLKQLYTDLDSHAQQILVAADRLETVYFEDITWWRIIESLEVLRDKWIPKAIAEAKELEKIAEENY